LNLNLTNQTQDMPKLLKKSKKEKALERIWIFLIFAIKMIIKDTEIVYHLIWNIKIIKIFYMIILNVRKNNFLTFNSYINQKNIITYYKRRIILLF
jgi:hypothetical protein